MTAGANDGAALPDENTLTIPKGWHRWVHPRRGGLVVPSVKGPDERAAEEARKFLADGKVNIDALRDEGGDRGLTRRTRRHLDGDANPVGAAGVALLATEPKGRSCHYNEVPSFFADLWTIEHGIAFAACAMVAADSMTVGVIPDGSPRWPLVLRRSDSARPRHFVVDSCARRVRTLLAVAGDAEYEEAVERLAEFRDTPGRRAMVSYLVPTRHDWAAQCHAEVQQGQRYRDHLLLEKLLLAAGTADHATALARLDLSGLSTAEVVATLLDGLGADALPVLVHFLNDHAFDKTERQRVLEAVGMLPSDEAFQALLDRRGRQLVRPALLAAMDRFPARALRLLAGEVVAARARGDAEAAAAVTELLAGHLLNHPDVVAAVEPALSEESRAVVTEAGSSERLPEAPADALPPLLVQPPWTRPRKKAKPVVIEGLHVSAEPALVWAEDERDTWTAPTGSLISGPLYKADTDWEAVVELFRAGRLSTYDVVNLCLDGPEELVRPALGSVTKNHRYWTTDDVAWMRAVIARFEADALPPALHAARSAPDYCSKLLMPFLDAEVAAFMAGLLEGARAARSSAVSWFERHGLAAARLLVPAAVGEHGKARREAESALLLVASRAGDDAVVETAREFGDRAADVVAELLAGRLERFPSRIPKVGEWADPRFLPQVRLRGNERALPLSAVRHLITMLAMSKPGDVYPGVDVVRQLCDLESLAEFSWELFQRWENNGAPSKERWALHQLAWLGDDETVRRLAPVIRNWPLQSGHRKAAEGVDVLAEIGSEVALLHLHGIAEKVKFKALKTKAREKLAEVASELGLRPDQLADRLVPDFGLDADGSMVLDYGPRRFVVGFDEQLKPYVTDEDGKRRKALPKPGAKDDPDLAPAAYKRFSALKKDVRTVASDRIGRLESAMLSGVRWTVPELRRLFVEHPLMWHLARRLVWLAESGDGRAVAFRLAEDRTFADVEDETVTLPEDASVRIPHPIDLGKDVPAWAEVFADYEITQPFPQLGREAHALTDEERASHRLTRFEGVTVPVASVLGLVRRGWERGEPQDAGVERWISKPLPGGLRVLIQLDMGILAVDAWDSGDQTLDKIWLDERLGDYRRRGTYRFTFGDLDRISASEVLADLTWLAGSAT